jgi:hypothetical protein
MTYFLISYFLVPIRIPIPVEPYVNVDIDETIISRAAEESRKIIRKQLALERELIRSGITYYNTYYNL